MEHSIVELVITVFMGFFAIMNPIANTAVFVGLTSSMSAEQARKTASRSLILAFAVVVSFSLMGKAIFEMFGITLAALRITGGVLVFIVGYQMLHGSSSKMHQHDAENNEADLAISPLAVPILAGPGTIATAMNYSASGGVFNISITIAMFALLCIISYGCFVSGPKLLRYFGNSGLSIVTRLMGLILAVIGVQMLIHGIHDAFLLFAPQ